MKWNKYEKYKEAQNGWLLYHLYQSIHVCVCSNQNWKKKELILESLLTISVNLFESIDPTSGTLKMEVMLVPP